MALLGAMVTVDRPARAEGETAAQLYKKGLKAMLAKDYETGCAALAESYGLEPLPGALYTLAECNTRWGKSATALEQYKGFLERVESMPKTKKAAQKKRIKIANERIEALEAKVAKLTIVLPPEAPAGTVVKRNGEPLPAQLVGTEVALDPGEYLITAELADGKQVGASATKLEAGQSSRLELQLELPEEPPAAAPAPSSPGPTKPDEPDEGEGGISPVWVWTAAGIGLAGIAAGSITGGLALADKDTVFDNCSDDRRCNDEGLDAADKVQTLALISNISFGVGIAGAGAAVVLFILSGDDGPEADSSAGLRPMVRGNVSGLEYRW
jgi:hypothetical protein